MKRLTFAWYFEQDSDDKTTQIFQAYTPQQSIILEKAYLAYEPFTEIDIEVEKKKTAKYRVDFQRMCQYAAGNNFR